MGLTATWTRFGLIASLAMACLSGTSVAGPARYDATQRGFRFTYTYASLTPGLFGEQAIGAPQQASPEQDAKVRAIVLEVSDALSKATGGRAKILSLDHVDDAKKADVIISLTGDPGRGGWAIAGAINGAPGQIGLYWETLQEEWTRDVVLTATHEVCHYIFGLTDEYNFPMGCPVANQGGPGCLMDNYLSNGSRHGWYGRFCREDHVLGQSQQPKSCQAMVDDFFKQFNLADQPKEQTPQNKIDNIANATIARVRQEAEARNKALGRGKKLTAISSLASIAKNFLTSQLQENGVDPKTVDVSKLTSTILQTAASVVSIDPPVRLAGEFLIDLVRRSAKERAEKLKKQNPKISDSTLKNEILKELKSIVTNKANAPLVTGSLNPEETSYLEHVAMQAAAATETSDINQRILDATLTHIKLSRNIARDTIDGAAEIGVPGIPERLAALGEIDADLRLYLPGRTASSGFGMRRTIILDPEPFNPKFDFILTDAGIFQYNALRAIYIGQFRRLVDRAKIELVVTDAQKDNEKSYLAETQAWLSGQGRDKMFQDYANRLLTRDAVRSERESAFRSMIAEVSKGVRSNRYENVILLVPPGDLPNSMVIVLESFRRVLMEKGDVRLDVVTVGGATFPAELRDACIGSGGTIATIADVDEVGALAQRLKNEQSTGAWVVLPQQGTVGGRLASLVDLRNDTRKRWLYSDPKVEQPKESAIADFTDQVIREMEKSLVYLCAPEAISDFEGPDGVLAGAGDDIRRRLLWTLQAAKAGTVSEGPSWMRLPDQLRWMSDAVGTINKSRRFDESAQANLFAALVKARTAESDAIKSIELLLNAYQPRINPEFDESALLTESYESANKLHQQEHDTDLLKLRRLQRVIGEIEKKLSGGVFANNPATGSYLRLRIVDLRIRSADIFLDHLEKELASTIYKPLFSRIDRNLQVEASRTLQDRAPGFISEIPGYPGRPPLPPVGLTQPGKDGNPVPVPGKIRLQRFYAENLKYDPKVAPGEFEFILGLSKPLPGVTPEAIRSLDTNLLPKLMLHNDDGMPIEAASLYLDQDVSTPTCLVWRFSPEFGIGWYTAAVHFSEATMRKLGSATLNYTFSIASNRPNIRLSPALIQVPSDPELVPPPPDRGRIRRTDRRARVEVQVFGGTSILKASVRGVLHKIDGGDGEILPLSQTFHDDGKTHGDKQAGDGIYTTVIPLDQLQLDAEYRLMIQAESTALSRNIAPENPSSRDEERRKIAKELGDKTILEKTAAKADDYKPEEALQFQRATSIHIRVER